MWLPRLQVLTNTFHRPVFFSLPLPNWSHFTGEGDVSAHDLGGFSPGQLAPLLLASLGWTSLSRVRVAEAAQLAVVRKQTQKKSKGL